MPNPWGTAISLAAARTIVVRALAHPRSSDFPPMTVAVLDAGQLVAFAREDGSSLRRGRIARAKARGALNIGVGSPSLAAQAWQPKRRPTPRSSTQWSPSPMATLCPPPVGCSCATTTTSSARSGSAGPCPMTTKPAQSTASPPRGLRAAPGAADST
jgi:hypothetical protein